jgi:hypothetical protein
MTVARLGGTHAKWELIDNDGSRIIVLKTWRDILESLRASNYEPIGNILFQVIRLIFYGLIFFSARLIL